MSTTLLLDYGTSRAQRLFEAMGRAGVQVTVSGSVEDVRAADRLVIPDGDDDECSLGRGARPGVFEATAQHVQRGRPLLAVGLGVQFLLGGATHAGMSPGLNLFEAPVVHFDPRMLDEAERPLKSPHVGFSLVVGLDRHPGVGHVVPAGADGLWLYFCHRLCAPARVPFAEVAVAHHGVPFAGAIWRDRILAMQFLPELSGQAGLKLLKAWDLSTQGASS